MAEIWRPLIEVIRSRLVEPLLSLPYFAKADISADEIATSLLVAAVQLAIIALVFRPLESLRPAERWPDRRLTRTDLQYTLVMVVGVLPLPLFIALLPLQDAVGGEGFPGLLPQVPWLQQHEYVKFLIYYLVFDFVYYWLHRAEHAIPWLWALHSLHHSQRQVSCWTNNRDCFVTGAIEAGVLASVGVVMGVDPSEFALLMLMAELLQNFSHTNVRGGFGRVLGKVLVGPDFHRLHHIRVAEPLPGRNSCNFAQAFPAWDILFGTALYGGGPQPTGVTDPVVDADNQLGIIGQQLAALRRFLSVVFSRAGWKPGDVYFTPDRRSLRE